MSDTVMVIEKTALASFEAALDAAGLPSAQWIGTNKTLRQSNDGHYVLIHDWSQCANDALRIKVATLLQVASETAGVHLVTEVDMAQGEKILNDWPSKVPITWVEKTPDKAV